MRDIVIASLVAAGIFGWAVDGQARDSKGGYIVRESITCETYLDAFSNTVMKGTSVFVDSDAGWSAFGWINGFVTGVNWASVNGRTDVVSGMSYVEVREWVAAWCQVHPAKDISDALVSLIDSRNN